MQGPQGESQTVSMQDILKKEPALQSALQVDASKSIKEQKSFRFLDLPFEIRSMIYMVCLISSSVTAVKINFTFDSIGIPSILEDDFLNWDELIGLVSDFSSRKPTKPEHRWLNAGLIRVSKGLYQEAASILYTHNTFKFEREEGITMDAFSFFQYNMAPTMRDTLQVFHLQIPPFKRFTYEDRLRARPRRDSHIRVPDRKLFACLKDFSQLETLHLHLYEDISSYEIKVLRTIDSICGKYKVILHAEKTGTIESDSPCDRLISIHADALAMISQRGWHLEGEVVTVTDEN